MSDKPDKHPIPRISLLQHFLYFLIRDKSCWVYLVVIIASGCLVALSVSLIPLAAAQLLIQILPGGNQQLLHSLSLALVVLLLTVIVVSWLGNCLIHQLLSEFLLKIRTEVCKKLLIFPWTSVDFSTNKISLYLFKYAEELYHNAVLFGVCFTRDLLIAIGLLSVMVWLSLDTAVLVLILLVIVFCIKRIFHTNIYRRDALNQRHHELSESISRTLRHNRIIYLDQGVEQENKHIQNIFKQFQHALLKQVYQTELFKLLTLIFLVGIVAGFFYYFLQQLTVHLLSVENAVAFIITGLLLIYPLKRLFWANLFLKKCNVALHSIFSLINQNTEVTLQGTSTIQTTERKSTKGDLRFEKVSYEDDQNSLRLPCFNLKIIFGKKIALINSNTEINILFVDLLCGFKQPSTGRIFLENKNVQQMDRIELHANIAWITPNKDLLSDTVAANIAYGNLRCSDEIAITSAAHASQAMEFIRKLPRGLQTKLDKANDLLTDGQRQRILIARALLKKPSIVILDESSACFDTDSASLMCALHILLAGRTVFIISSRPVLQQLADQLLDPVSLMNKS